MLNLITTVLAWYAPYATGTGTVLAILAAGSLWIGSRGTTTDVRVIRADVREGFDAAADERKTLTTDVSTLTTNVETITTNVETITTNIGEILDRLPEPSSTAPPVNNTADQDDGESAQDDTGWAQTGSKNPGPTAPVPAGDTVSVPFDPVDPTATGRAPYSAGASHDGDR